MAGVFVSVVEIEASWMDGFPQERGTFGLRLTGIPRRTNRGRCAAPASDGNALPISEAVRLDFRGASCRFT